jgi:hypothetical protein
MLGPKVDEKISAEDGEANGNPRLTGRDVIIICQRS